MYPTVMCRGVLQGGTTWKLWKKTWHFWNSRNNEAENTEKFFGKAEKEQDIQSDSKKKAAMFYPLKEDKEIIVIESDNE